jgi:predicted CXXCH cytochrome family protein
MTTQLGYDRIRFARGSKGGLLLLLVISADSASKFSKLAAADSTEHPYVGKDDLKSETCLTCHPSKNQGKYVHTAVSMGCDSCHQLTSTNDHTAITLRAMGGGLCAKCHEINKKAVQHGPYRAGKCILCHNPHTGAYKAETRASVATLCLTCHLANQPDVKVDSTNERVYLLDGMVYSLSTWQSAPKIGAGHGGNSPSRKQGAGRESGTQNPENACLTCHEPHAGKAEHLLRQGAENRGGEKVRASDYVNDIMSGSIDVQYVPENESSYLREPL